MANKKSKVISYVKTWIKGHQLTSSVNKRFPKKDI